MIAKVEDTILYKHREKLSFESPKGVWFFRDCDVKLNEKQKAELNQRNREVRQKGANDE